jgi:hypothetical protein
VSVPHYSGFEKTLGMNGAAERETCRVKMGVKTKAQAGGLCRASAAAYVADTQSALERSASWSELRIESD